MDTISINVSEAEIIFFKYGTDIPGVLITAVRIPSQTNLILIPIKESDGRLFGHCISLEELTPSSIWQKVPSPIKWKPGLSPALINGDITFLSLNEIRRWRLATLEALRELPEYAESSLEREALEDYIETYRHALAIL